MKRSGVVLHVLAPMHEGGLERVVTMIAAGATSRGVHIAAVIAPNGETDHPFVQELESRGVSCTTVIARPRDYVGEYRQLSAVMRRVEPAVVHTHGYRADVIGGIAGRSHQLPVVSTMHGFTGGTWRNRFYERVQMTALKRANAVIAVSGPLVPRLVAAGISPDRIHCIPNGFRQLAPLQTREAARRRLGIDEKDLVAGWVGRLSPEKGADVMLAALARSHSEWKLSIIGDGPDMASLRRQADALDISDRVRWHGRIAHAGSLLSAFNAFVLSSRTEGTPIALLEAMSAEVPIVATAVGGVPDVVKSSQAMLVPPDDPTQIAEALANVRDFPAEARDRSHRAKQRLLEAFSYDAWLSAMDDVYDAVER